LVPFNLPSHLPAQPHIQHMHLHSHCCAPLVLEVQAVCVLQSSCASARAPTPRSRDHPTWQ
jgi:hypothetical protein